ncbi:flagellar basal body rod protein FlgC [Patulibacter sp. SYSU D01012]|uniref:flagellar basal body rod protein FlgC n=1 Tax=Patulibacter sp. SYSU D01012 TaxID=2817381 RepID=UPI001B305C27|nr:flagellar basal body rod protein FlgC [Patulibacter sp. SYSU D01012]
MSILNALDVSASGLTASRVQLDVTSENLANAQTTRTAAGGPYQRKTVVLQSADGGQGFGTTLASAMGGSAGAARGVQVAAITPHPAPPRMVYDPGHPDANADGYVAMPAIDSVTEMVDLIAASRGYEANVTAMQSAKQMFTRTLDLLR